MTQLVYLIVCGGFVGVAWCLEARIRHVVAWVLVAAGAASLVAALSAPTVVQAAVNAAFVLAGTWSAMWLLTNGRSFGRASRAFESARCGWREVTVSGGRIGRVEPTSYGCTVVVGFDLARVVTVDVHGVQESLIDGGQVAFPLAGDPDEVGAFAERLMDLDEDVPVDATLEYELDRHSGGQRLVAGSMEIGHLRATIGEGHRHPGA